MTKTTLWSTHIWQGAFWAAIAVTVWSGSLVMMRFGMTTSLNAFDLAALRFGTAALILLPVLLKTDQDRDRAFTRLGLRGFVLMVVCFGAPYIVLVSYALTSVPASAAGALNPGMMAVFSVLFGWAILRNRPATIRLAGAGLVLGGSMIGVLFDGGTLDTGHLLLILSGAMWATYALVVRKTGLSALHATSLVAVGSAVFYLPLYLTLLPTSLWTAPLIESLMQAVFQGVLSGVIAVFAFNRSTELLGPIIGAALVALIPLVTLLIGALTLHEPARESDILSALVIGLGVAFILAGRKSSKTD